MKTKGLIFIGCIFAAWFVLTANAEQLPIKSFTPAEGLVHERVRCIKRDSHGFLWFCTGDGLSRFDGYTFTNYNSAQGLQQPAINDLIERRDGSYWLATNGGAILFNPFTIENEAKFTLFSIGDKSIDSLVQTFYEDGAGRLWAGTTQGLFYLDESNEKKEFRRVELNNGDFIVNRILEDAEGSLWIATGNGIVRRLPDGRLVKYQFAVMNNGEMAAKSLLFDDENRLWVGFIGGLLILKPEPAANVNSERHLISAAPATLAATEKFHLPDITGTETWMVTPNRTAQIYDLAKLSDGSIWIANRGAGMFEFQNGVLHEYTVEQGLSDSYVNVIEEDSANNIWIGTETSGAMRITRHGFTTFRESDGIKRKYIREVFETNDGVIVTITSATEMSYLNNDRFVPLKLSILSDMIIPPTLGRETPFQDHLGEWWIAAKNGLYHYPKLENLEAFATVQPKAIYTEKNGLPNLNFEAINEDSRGDIWIGTTTGNVLLTRWERATGKFYNYTEADGVPVGSAPFGFTETPNGDVWFSLEENGVLRYRDGKFHQFTQADGIPSGVIPTLFSDSAGRLWIPSWRGGVMRIDNPAEDKLKFTAYTPSNGLSSINARCVTEDEQGRIYVGTVRGVDRIEVENGGIRHYTVADGLSYSEIGSCFRDSRNTLWFATYRGLSKFSPESEENSLPSPTLINGLHVAGVAVPISELGTGEINDLQFEPSQNQLEIDFFSLSFASGESLRYQYKLGLSNTVWSEPTVQHAVNFANLAPGDYHFFVRAIDSAGKTGKPAAVNFIILQPLWRRWWFLLLAIVFVISVILSIERTRAARLRELKNAFGKLSVSENRFRQMNDQSPLGIIVFAPDGSIRSVNRAYEKFWGVSYEQIRNWDFLSDEQIIKTGVAEKLRLVFSGKTVTLPPLPYDPQINSADVKVDKNAAVRWIQAFAYPVKTDAGELLEVILVMEDVTDSKRADEAARNARRDRLRELEQVRRRIAADLHDDIGSSLTQISIFSEVLQQRIDKTNQRILEPLEFIASSSRELVDAMSDIVWAINPHKDFLSELTGKMHRFAADIFTARDIAFTFNAPHFKEEFALGANLRREVFLIFKESVNNIVKHARCTSVEIQLLVDNSEICLSLGDNGAGFDVSQVIGGHGLISMRQRAADLGGTLKIFSNNAAGTTITLLVPLPSANTDEKFS